MLKTKINLKNENKKRNTLSANKIICGCCCPTENDDCGDDDGADDCFITNLSVYVMCVWFCV